MEHTITAGETSDSIMRNEIVYMIECGRDVVASRNFNRVEVVKDPNITQEWAKTVLEEHKETCRFELARSIVYGYLADLVNTLSGSFRRNEVVELLHDALNKLEEEA